MNETILGIETSYDETAAAIYTSTDGVLSNELFSQIDLHAIFGGLVPEIASRSHLEKIEPIVTAALTKAQVTLDDIRIFAFTRYESVSLKSWHSIYYQNKKLYESADNASNR